MKRTTTDRLLTLDMALCADKRTMEQRVRGVFARRRSARFARVLTAILCLVLGIGCFTTACVPARKAPVDVVAAGANAAIGAGTATPASAPAASAGEAKSGPLVTGGTDSFVNGLEETPFVPADAPARIARAATEIAPGVTLAFNADVTVPQTDGYSVARAMWRALADAEVLALMEYFLPDANWTVRSSAAGPAEGDAFDITQAEPGKDFQIDTERDGETYSVAGRREGDYFSFHRSKGIVYREGYLLGDPEMEAAFGKAIRQPIPLTQAQAQAVADRALSDLGIAGLALQRADRACLFGARGGEGGVAVLSRGWDFVYMPDNNGLTVPYHGGANGGAKDPLAYSTLREEWIWLYVDEAGVSRFYWNNTGREPEPLLKHTAVIGAEEVADLAAARLQRQFSHVKETDALIVTIEVTGIRLCAAVIGDPAGRTGGVAKGAADAQSSGLLIPAWEVSCVTRHGGEAATGFNIEYCYLPFNAIDGGALMQRAN